MIAFSERGGLIETASFQPQLQLLGLARLYLYVRCLVELAKRTPVVPDIAILVACWWRTRAFV